MISESNPYFKDYVANILIENYSEMKRVLIKELNLVLWSIPGILFSQKSSRVGGILNKIFVSQKKESTFSEYKSHLKVNMNVKWVG